jgi:AcrR family transcriptional regulator
LAGVEEATAERMKPMTTEPTLSPTAMKILVTAKGLFMQRGYRAVSVNDIVQAAEITKPTLYYHFADKEELFAQMSLHMVGQMHADMVAALEGRDTTAERLAALADVMTTTADGDTRMMRHEMREHLSPAQRARIGLAFQQQIVEPINHVMSEGLARGELGRYTAAELTWMFLSLIEGFYHEPQAEGDAAAGAHFSSDTLVDLFLYGVAPRGTR